MRFSILLLAAAAVAPPVRAADKPLFMTEGQQAEDNLRRFVECDPRLKVRLDDAARREETLAAADRDPDLRDAVSDASDRAALLRQMPGFKTLPASGSESDPAAQLQALPGFKARPASTCHALSDCAAPAFSIEVSDAELLPDALRRLVRPWMLLQQARSSEAKLIPAAGAGDAALEIELKGLASAPLTLNVTPNRPGGFTVWFDRPQELAALYVRERDAALKSAR